MAAAQTGAGDARQWESPRPKGRENAKNTLCRNVVIYGYCRHEKDGCMYNHDTTKPSSAVQPQNDSLKKRFNVESPSFTPSFTDTNGGILAVKTPFSPKAANAAPFTPKSAKASLASPPVLTRPRSSEWSNHEIHEFVPQNYTTSNAGDHSLSSGLGDPFNPYSESSSYSGLDATPPSQINPYAADVSGTGAASYYQTQNAYAQPLQHHLYAPLGPHRENLQGYQRTAHDFFISENLRQELQRKADATLQILPNSNLPAAIEHFHSLVPLDTNNQKSAVAFGYNSWVYKAVSSKDGLAYVLRRLEGFRLTSERAVRSVQSWKRISNGGVVGIHDCFTTRAFGDSSLVFVTDFHPLSKTLAEQHLPYASNFHRTRSPGGPVSEAVFWSYIVQMASALKAIHSNGLAARLITPSKVLLTNKNRIRLNACAILDVVQPNEQRSLQTQQQEDMQQFGRLMLALATQNANPASTPKVIESISRTYSARLRDCITTLIETPPDIDAFIATIADHFATQLDNSLHSEDALYSDLNRELENARLVRLLTKLGFVNERPEYNSNNPDLSVGHGGGVGGGAGGAQHGGGGASAWSETGERYYLKLFRDYVFHHVGADGRPVVDLGHVITCLNKLDAGSEEKIALVTRDEQNVFVVSYKEVKRGLESAFQELLKAQRRM